MNLFNELIIKELNISFNQCDKRPDKKPRVIWSIAYLGSLITFHNTGEYMNSYNLPDDKKAVVSIKPVDKFGVPVAVDGPVIWTVSDESILTIATSDDGATVKLAPVTDPVKPNVPAQVSATFDADLGEGVTPVTTVIEVTVVGSQAVGGEIVLTLVDDEPPIELPVE